jgi:hypothetical protein
MKIFRAIARALFVILTSASLAILIILATLQMTILNRANVLGWLDNSGIYKNIVDSIVQLQPSTGTEQQLLGENTVRQAINKTLDPAFLEQSTEKILNGTYDWLEGKNDKIVFTVPLSEKRTELKSNLAELVKPSLEGLPVCSSTFSGVSTQQVKCIPPNSNPQKYADDLSNRAIESSDFLSAPLTEKDIQQPMLPAPGLIRFIMNNTPALLASLVAIAILSATGYVLLSGNKLLALQNVGRRTFFGTLIMVLVGAALWYFASKFTLSAFGDKLIIDTIIDPLARLIASDVGRWLFIFSGIVFSLGGLIWLGTFLLIKKSLKQAAQIPKSGDPKNLPPVTPPAI